MKELMTLTPKDLMKRAVANGQHPRTLIVATAKAAIGYAICQVEEKYGLTAIESVQCLADVIQLSMKYALRVERHGDSEYPADAPPEWLRTQEKCVAQSPPHTYTHPNPLALDAPV